MSLMKTLSCCVQERGSKNRLGTKFTDQAFKVSFVSTKSHAHLVIVSCVYVCFVHPDTLDFVTA